MIEDALDELNRDLRMRLDDVESGDIEDVKNTLAGLIQEAYSSGYSAGKSYNK